MMSLLLLPVAIARGEEKPAKVLTYVRAKKGHASYVLFVAPQRDYEKPRKYRLHTPKGEVIVECDPPHTANPPRTWASEISYPLDESLFHFRAPKSLPIHIEYEYGGNATSSTCTLHAVKINGKIRYPLSNVTYLNPKDRAPIVMTGTRNTLALIICDSGGE